MSSNAAEPYLTLDVDYVNRIANHTAVRGTIEGGRAPLDAAAFMLTPGNMVYTDGAGGAVALEHLGGLAWQGHILCLPSARGAQALALGKGVLKAMFTDQRASRVVAYVPLWLPNARFLCRGIGMRSTGRDLFVEYFTAESVEWAE